MMSKFSQTYKVQPWFNKKEWKEVASKIFSNEIKERKWAVEMIAAWKLRVGDKLAMPIDVTEDLVMANIEYELLDPEQVPLKCKSLQTQYSMAIIRFINFIADITGCAKSGVPIRSVLSQLALPQYLADLHRDASHHEYPSLEMLQHGTHMALEWLRENYWIPEEATIESFSPLSESIAQTVHSHLEHFQKYSYENLLKKKIQSKDMSGCLQSLETFLTEHPNKFLEVLASPGNLLPPSFYLTTLEHSKGESYVKDDDIKLPPVAKSLWHPLLAIINKYGLLQNLAEYLLMGQSKFSLLADKLIVSWVSYLLQLEESEANIGIIPVWNYLPLLRCSLKAPSRYILEILPMLIENLDPPLTQERKDKLISLITIYLGTFNEAKLKLKPEKIYSRKDIEGLFHGKQLSINPECNPTPWSLYEEPDPSKPLPLGSIIPEPIEMRMLEPENVPPEEQIGMAPSEFTLNPVSLDDPDLDVEPESGHIRAGMQQFLAQSLIL